MNRLFVTLTACALLLSAQAGLAQAKEWGATMFSVSSGAGKNNGFSELRYADGVVKSYSDYVKDTRYGVSGAGKSYMTYTNDMQGDLYQPWANQYLPDEHKYVSSNTYYHSSYIRMYNPKGASANPLTGGSINVEFDVKHTGAGAAKQTVGTAIDFHWWENPTDGTAWLVFTELAWSLGTITDASGVNYELYFELKDQSTDEESAYTKLVGNIYNDVLEGIGLNGNPNLYAWAIPDGQEMWMAFKMSAYGSAANPHATPIPGAALLLGTGLAGILALRGRKRG